MIAVAIAVACWDVRTSALVDVSWAAADAACIEFSHAVIYVVTDAIGIGVFRAVTPTHAECVELVLVAVAVSFWDVRTSALVDLSRAVAHTAGVELPHAAVFVVADAVKISVSRTIATALKQGVKLGAVAVAISSRNGFTTALVDGSWSVANPAGVQHAHTVVHVVADAIGIVVRGTIAATCSNGIRVVKTGTVVIIGSGIVVARSSVSASASVVPSKGTRSVECHGDSDIIGSFTLGKDLII